MIPWIMGEANTPLVQSAQIGPSMGLSRLYFKLEMCNPSGSYKDRFISAEVRQILSAGMRGCVATSSGNTGSSLAAYCARIGISCTILVGENIPEGKLTQMRAHGARVFRIREFVVSPAVTNTVFECLASFSQSSRIALVISAYRYCPSGMTAVELIAQEIRQQCGTVVDHVFVPVGGGGLFSAMCRGFASQPEARPRLHAVQPAGCSTVVAAFQQGRNEILPVRSTTHVSGLSVPTDIDGQLALQLLRQFGGLGFTVTDGEVMEAQKLLLRQEGIYAEPAGAAALAGLLRAMKDNVVRSKETTICMVTGHGFKDPGSIEEGARTNPARLIASSQLQDVLSDLEASCA